MDGVSVITTWAYRNGTLAADSLTTVHGQRAGFVRKIKQVGPFLLSFSGSLSLAEAWVHWVASGMDPEKEPPRLIDNKDNSEYVFGHLFLGGDCHVAFEPNGTNLTWAPFVAGGSGSEYALGAMEMGASAVEAVAAAIKFDTSSGGPINVLTMDKVAIPGVDHYYAPIGDYLEPVSGFLEEITGLTREELAQQLEEAGELVIRRDLV